MSPRAQYTSSYKYDITCVLLAIFFESVFDSFCLHDHPARNFPRARLIPILVVVFIETFTDLLVVDGVIGGVNIDNEFVGCRVGLNELFDERFLQGGVFFLGDTIFETAKGGE